MILSYIHTVTQVTDNRRVNYTAFAQHCTVKIKWLFLHYPTCTYMHTQKMQINARSKLT